MSNEDQNQNKIKQVKIKPVHNGYTVEAIISSNTSYADTLVFETFEKMVQWLKENLKEPGSKG